MRPSLFVANDSGVGIGVGVGGHVLRRGCMHDACCMIVCHGKSYEAEEKGPLLYACTQPTHSRQEEWSEEEEEGGTITHPPP
jgi:hypothetical protein